MRNNGDISSDPVATLDAILECVDEKEPDGALSTEADDRWAHALHQTVKVRIAAMRRQLTPFHPHIKSSSQVCSTFDG